MHILKLNINDKIYPEVISLLSKFENKGLEIEEVDVEFLSNKKYLEQELEEVVSGKAKFYTQDEVELKLSERIEKYKKGNI